MPKLGFLKIAALFSINIVITSTTNHPRPTPRRRSLEVNKYINIYSDFDVFVCIYTSGSCSSPSDQPEPNRAGLGALPGTQTNIRCGLQPAVHLPVRGGLLDISTYLFIYISTYLHIYISRWAGRCARQCWRSRPCSRSATSTPSRPSAGWRPASGSAARTSSASQTRWYQYKILSV